MAGKLNTVVDGLSRKWEGTTRAEGDGSEWTVNPEPEETLGVINDIYTIYVIEKAQTQHEQLQMRFEKEPIFKEVIDAILNLDMNVPIRDRMRAQH